MSRVVIVPTLYNILGITKFSYSINPQIATLTEFHQVETCITSSINAISKEDVLATIIVAEVENIMKFECKDVKKEREHESTDVDKLEGVSSLFFKQKCYEACLG